jgi:hypothetical protein
MAKDTQTAVAALKEAAEGLTFPSESDYPVEPFVLPGTATVPVEAEPVLQALGHETTAPVRTPPLTRFFHPATAEQDWHNDEERATARRFQELVSTLKEHLSDIKVLKVGKVQSDVYVVGKTASGDLAGVKTKVVET